MNEKIEEIKRKVMITRLCEENGIDLRKAGKEFKCLCPFHKETDPSCSIDPEKNLYYCFGCGKGGSVIDFYMELKGLKFTDAVNELCSKAGLNRSNVQEPESGKKKQRIQRIYNIALEYFHYHLLFNIHPEQKNAFSYIKNRGIEMSPLPIFKIGYAPSSDSLIKLLRNIYLFSDQEIIESGLARPDSDGRLHAFFKNRIIFPFLSHGDAIYFLGRAIYDDEPCKHLFLPKNDFFHKPVFYTDSLNESGNEIFITEGIIDCILAEQNGFPTVALCGLTMDIDYAKKLKGKQIFIVFDNDSNEAGQKAALTLAKMLIENGVEPKIIRLPKPKKVSKVDLADYLKIEGKEEFLERKKEAKGPIEILLEEIKDNSLGDKYAKIKEKIFPLLLVLDDAKSAIWIENIKEHFKFKTEIAKVLRSDFKAARKNYLSEQPIDKSSSQPYEMSKEEQDQAIDYLKRADLIQCIKNDLTTIGIVGEEENALSLYLFSLTRKTKEPISAVLFGDSSSGKSYLVKAIASLIPEEDRMVITSASPRSFEYGNEEQLKYKFIVIQEIEGMDEVEPIIRVMQSEGKLARYVPIQKYEGGPYESEHREVECPACIVTTTTRDKVHPENSTRIFELYLDQSTAQTALVNDLSREKESYDWIEKENEIEMIRALHKNVQRCIPSIRVIIPFVKFIDFPSESTRNRRDLPRFLNLIKTVALLRQFQKEVKQDGEASYIEADLEDYKVAFELGKKLIASSLCPVSERTKDILRVILAIDKETFTRRDIRDKAKEMGIQISLNHTTFKSQLEELEEFAIERKEGGQGKIYSYKKIITSLDKLEQVEAEIIPSPDKLRERIANREKEIEKIFNYEEPNTEQYKSDCTS